MEKGMGHKKSIYLPKMATLVRAEPITDLERFFEFRLDSGEELGQMPGQFAMVSVLGVGEAPISISSSPTQTGSFQMVVRKVGNVTNAMHKLIPGDKVGIRGPYGTPFPVDTVMKGKDIIFICGGLGLVPVRSAINYVMHYYEDYGNVTILYGMRNPQERLFAEEFNELACREGVCLLETCDRGDEHWTGKVGVVTTLMMDMVIEPRRTVAIVCGPPIMYRFVIAELHKMGMLDDNIYVSLERHMKCGVGKCGHCQINDLYVCKDGPVFRYTSLIKVPEAIK
ncbi:FAD/NAD(P)-binding protein [Chloroflexota bacterium]